MAHRVILNLNVFSSTPLYAQVADELKDAIFRRVLKQGERLPSIRDLAKQLQISVITVREAIEKLVEAGIVESRHGSGNFVSLNLPAPNTASVTENFEPLQFTQSRYESTYHDLDSSLPWSTEVRELNRSFNESAFHPWWDASTRYEFRVYEPIAPVDNLHYRKGLSGWAKLSGLASDTMTDPRGSYPLRHELSRWLNKSRNLECTPDEVFITSGAQQGRDLLARILTNQNDQVLIEEPASITDLLAYASKGAKLIHVPMQHDGIDVSELERNKSAVVAHLISTAHFPSGSSMSLLKRQQVVNWSAENEVVIVEDAYGAGFYHVAPIAPTLFQLARQHEKKPCVAYIGSLSQFLTPALRLGFVVLPKRLQQSWIRTKWLVDRHTSSFAQQVALKMLVDGHLEEDALRIAQAARSRRLAMLEGLRQYPEDLISFTPVEAGFQQSFWFKKPIDDILVFEKCLAAGIGVIPISPYFRKCEPRPGLSLSFMHMNEEKIALGLRELLAVIQSVQDSASIVVPQQFSPIEVFPNGVGFVDANYSAGLSS
jgi:GntR family transcriptional regulator/MocR family aminotransferase